MLKILAISLISIVMLLTDSETFAQSVTPPSFQFCPNPAGTVRVSYPSGSHGIVGSTQSHSGSDSVYDLPDGNHVQCFCAEDGSGIQTNWWDVSSLSQDQIETLKTQGWVYIPNGQLWGLADKAYLAINNNFSCKSGVGNVLGLASTGNLPLIIGSGLVGILLIILGLRTRKKSTY